MRFTWLPWLTLALLTPTAWSSPATLDRLEASVNSTLILLSDIAKFRQTMPLRAQLDPLFAGTSVAAAGPAASNAQIVQFLIEEKIISQAFPIADPEVEQEINSILNSNHIDRANLKNTLKDQGFAYDDYFELIRASAAKRNLIDRDIRTKVTVSDDDVKNFYVNKYSKDTAVPLNYRVKIITVTPANYKSQGAAKDTIEHALKDIHGGETFEEVAKRVSDDSTASAGGDLGLLSEEQISPLIKTQLKKMKVGEVSPVLGSSTTSFFIVKLADVSTGESAQFDRIKEEIRGQLATSEYQHQIALWLERQRQTAFIHLAGDPSIAGLKGGH